MRLFFAFSLFFTLSGGAFSQDLTQAEKTIDSLVSRGKFPTALPLAQTRFDELAAQPEADIFQKSRSVRWLATCHKNMGKQDLSLQIMGDFIRQNTEEGQRHHPSVVGMLMETGSLLMDLRRFEEAEGFLTEARFLADSTGKVPLLTQANILSQIGRLNLMRKELEKAETVFLEAIEFMETQNLDNERVYLAVCNNIMAVYYTLGNNDSFGKYAAKALATARRNNYPKERILNNLATMQFKNGDIRGAEASFLELKSLMEKNSSKNEGYAGLLFNLGRVYDAMGNDLAGADYYVQAHQQFRALNLTKSAEFVRSVVAYASWLRKQKKFGEAKELLQKTIDGIAATNENEPLLLELERNLVRVESDSKTGYTLEFGRRMLGLLERASKLDYPGSKTDLFVLNVDLMGYWSSVDNFEEFDKSLGAAKSLLDSLGYDRVFYERELTSYELIYRGYAGRFGEAARAGQTYFHHAWKNMEQHMPFFSASNRLKFYQTLKPEFNYAFEFRSASEQFALSEEVLDCQINLKNLLLDFDRSNRKKLAAYPDKTIRRNFEQWQNLRERYFNLLRSYPLETVEADSAAQSLKTRFETLERELLKTTDAFQNLRRPQNTTCAEIRKALPPDAAAIEFFRFFKPDFMRGQSSDSAAYAALVLRKNQTSPELVFFKNGDELETFQLEKFIAEARKTGAVNDGQLYGAFWAPLEPFLQGIRTVFISQDGVFHKINPEILRLPDGRFLSEVHDFQRVNVLADILRKAPETPATSLAGRPAALFGNPDFSAENAPAKPTGTEMGGFRSAHSELDAERGLKLEALPGSEKEVNSIAAMLRSKGFAAETFTGSAASEEQLKTTKSPAIIHLATHGYFLENPRKSRQTIGFGEQIVLENPLLRSMLFFSGAQRSLDKAPRPVGLEDGILTAEEAQDLNLEGCELAVLSACGTGLGKIETGEGVFGLQRAFQVAGAKTLIVSLWQVEDRVTQLFMTVFYEKWLGGLSKRAAFREAQSAVRRAFPEPFYWGAFVLLGS